MATSLAASLALHGAALVALALASPPRFPELPTPAGSAGGGGGGSEGEELVPIDVDLEAPPEPPEAHDPGAEPEPEREQPEAGEEAPPPGEATALAPGEIRDAGASDAIRDAGASPPADAGFDASPDATRADDAPADADLEERSPADAARAVTEAGAATRPGEGDAGVRAPAARDAEAPSEEDPLAAAAGGEEAPPGASADLGNYAPDGAVVGALLRLDRFGGTAWEDRVFALLEPTPDYRAIVGERDIELSAHFDLLAISSSEPESVSATTLAARSPDRDVAARELLDREGAPVSFEPAAGGEIGERGPSAVHAPGDPRLYVLPEALENWLALAHPADLGELATAPPAADAELPEWLKRKPELAEETGEGEGAEDGPAALVWASAFPERIQLPRAGAAPGPTQVTATFEIDPQGFRVRGTLRFDDAADARAFEDAIDRFTDEFVAAPYGRALLERFHAYSAARGLSLSRDGDRVGFATSMSVADARAALDFAADYVERYFEAGAPPPGPEDLR